MASRVKPSKKRKTLSAETDRIVSRVLVITAAQVAVQLQEDHGFTEDEAAAFLAKLRHRLAEYGRALADLHHELELPMAAAPDGDATPEDTPAPDETTDDTAA